MLHDNPPFFEVPTAAMLHHHFGGFWDRAGKKSRDQTLDDVPLKTN